MGRQKIICITLILYLEFLNKIGVETSRTKDNEETFSLTTEKDVLSRDNVLTKKSKSQQLKIDQDISESSLMGTKFNNKHEKKSYTTFEQEKQDFFDRKLNAIHLSNTSNMKYLYTKFFSYIKSDISHIRQICVKEILFEEECFRPSYCVRLRTVFSPFKTFDVIYFFTEFRRFLFEIIFYLGNTMESRDLDFSDHNADYYLLYITIMGLYQKFCVSVTHIIFSKNFEFRSTLEEGIPGFRASKALNKIVFPQEFLDHKEKKIKDILKALEQTRKHYPEIKKGFFCCDSIAISLDNKTKRYNLRYYLVGVLFKNILK